MEKAKCNDCGKELEITSSSNHIMLCGKCGTPERLIQLATQPKRKRKLK
ncbi:hypothetical protein SP15_262 [Bacillus phage SP-15]|uniref:Uncharacterized protein n=1 Tax=Bacillus phage SP-15 TaxID=1792032 RepID=A0A127AWJ4_9CAUD|nr:hypothetical protein SP15_262 [Bacillus phage SP-15]AMM45069.1 hypothetical protein SP15_262 [Bacillus phage SP-15]